MNSFICILILLLSFTKLHSQSVIDNDDEWELGYHPFPEMSRFLNPYSRIHYQSSKRTSTSRPTHSLLEYICSIANKNEHIEEILIIFGENYRSLIQTIIKNDCSNNKRNKSPTININVKNFS